MCEVGTASNTYLSQYSNYNSTQKPTNHPTHKTISMIIIFIETQKEEDVTAGDSTTPALSGR